MLFRSGNKHHCVFRFNGSQIQMWVDGVAGTPTSTSGTVASGADSVLLGQYSTNYWAGILDDVRFYRSALSTGQIATLYGSGSGGSLGDDTIQVPSNQVQVKFPSTTTVTLQNNTGGAGNFKLLVYTP